MGKAAVFGSDKGGIGKTTTVANLASAMANKGKSVAILKSDKNPDLLNWNQKRQNNGLPPVPVYEAYGDISKEIQRLKKNSKPSLSTVQVTIARSSAAR